MQTSGCKSTQQQSSERLFLFAALFNMHKMIQKCILSTLCLQWNNNFPAAAQKAAV